MTERYDLLLKAINDTDVFIVKMFLFAMIAVTAYPVLEWTPVWMRRLAKGAYLVAMLALFFSLLFIRGAKW